MLQSVRSLSATGYPARAFRIARSVSTSRWLYSRYMFHRSGASHGSTRVFMPLAFEGLHGLENCRISFRPSCIFCLSSGSPSAAPAAARDRGSPISAAVIIVSSHCSGGIARPVYLARHVRSKLAFQAHFVISGSVRASIRSGIRSSDIPVRSTTLTGSSSKA